MSLCIVTAFLDLGRSNWSTFPRSIKQYFNNFMPYLKLNHDMVIFMDDKHYDEFITLVANHNNITVIKINRSWMQNNIRAYQQLNREKLVMNNKEFQNKVAHRLHHPECCKAEYNMIQHAKIDFLAYVINTVEYDYYAWSDFGYFQNITRIPQRNLDINKFDLTKVNFQAINEITQQDFDIDYTLTKAPERIGGFFYLGNKENLLLYQELYHSVCDDFYNRNIVDDDQHIMIQCIYRKPDLFKVWNLGGWHLVYNYFQLHRII